MIYFTQIAYYLFGLAVLANSLVLSLYLKRSVNRLILLVVIFLLYTLSTALIYLLLDFYFLGLAYIIVYCGAIAIIFLFVIMMIRLIELPQMASNNNRSALLIAISMPILILANYDRGFWAIYPLIITYVYPVVTSLIFTSTAYDILNLGSLIYIAYPISLLLIAVSLWMIMIGIIQLLIKNNRDLK